MKTVFRRSLFLVAAVSNSCAAFVGNAVSQEEAPAVSSTVSPPKVVQAAEEREFPHNQVTLTVFHDYVNAGEVPILDARSLEDYNAGHVPRAIHLAAGADFYRDFKKLEPKLGRYRDRLVFVYCSDQWCGAGDDLWLQLVAQGYQHIVRFPGGWAEWQKAKLPEETINKP